MAERVYKIYSTKTLFTYKHKFYNDDGQLTQPTSFEFETSDGNEFHYLWRFQYILESTEDSGSDIFADLLYMDEDNPRKNTLNGIRFSLNESLMFTDIARVIVIIDGIVYFEGYFNSKHHVMSKTLRELNVKIYSDSDVYVKIAIHHNDKSMSYLIGNYNKFLKSKKLYDVVFCVKNNNFLGHTPILSLRSPVFASMFETNMLEKKNKKVKIIDVEPNIFRHLLRYVYRGEIITTNLDEMLKLIIAADKYLVQDLLEDCTSLLCRKLTADSVIDVLLIADLLYNQKLKTACMKFVYENKREVVKTEAYKSLKVSRADLVSEMLNFILENM